MQTQQQLDELRGRLLRAHYKADDMTIVSRLITGLSLIARQLPDPLDRERVVARLRDEADRLERPLLLGSGRTHGRTPHRS